MCRCGNTASVGMCKTEINQIMETMQRGETGEDVAAVAATQSGATREERSSVFLAQSRTFSQRHPVIWHLTTLSTHIICNLQTLTPSRNV